MTLRQTIETSQDERTLWSGLVALHGDRAAAARAFLAYRGVTFAWLAERLGVHVNTVRGVIDGRVAPAGRVDALAGLGVPLELLPSPGDANGQARGPRLER